MTAKNMKAVVIREPGGPEVLKIEELPIPTPISGWVLIRVKAFGLNRSEMYTRQGHSPSVAFPRVLGIEAVGVVEAAPGGEFKPGDLVATAMGEMGRAFDGGYAEFTLVPSGQVQKIKSSLSWEVLGALPEMVQTAWGALHKALRLTGTETVLIRGGTSSVGLTAALLAKEVGATVISTTRKPERLDLLRENGADHVVLETGEIAGDIRDICTHGVDKVLELVGTKTLADSLQATAVGGIVAMTGVLGNEWVLRDFAPMDVIPTGVNLTIYGGGADDFIATPLQSVIDVIEHGRMFPPLGPVFGIDDIVSAHRAMDHDQAAGKIVVMTSARSAPSSLQPAKGDQYA
ncbi:MAG: zinc-binding alcohol dehydrogenase family protein [Pseudomonadota bacterium]